MPSFLPPKLPCPPTHSLVQANALARYSKVHAALLNMNKPVQAAASLRGKRGLGVAPGVFRVRLDISEKAKRIHKKHDAVRPACCFVF
jgi:hypothetical protein